MWERIFTTYWPQVTLVLLGAAYFIKRVFDHKSKKLEINHTLYQQNRIAAITGFYRNYAAVELMWKQIQIWGIVQNKLSADDIDKYIWPSINSLKTSIIELQIYFQESEHKLLEDILRNILDVNQELSLLLFTPDPNSTLATKTNRFITYRDQIFDKNNLILKNFASIVKSSFSS